MERDNTPENISIQCLNCKKITTVQRVTIPCDAVSLRSNVCPECMDGGDMEKMYKEWFVDKNDRDFL